MSSYDDEFDDYETEGGPGPEADGDDAPGAAGTPGGTNFRDWLNAKRGWLLIAGLALAQALFATIMIYMRSEARPTEELTPAVIRDLAVDMLGREVKIDQVYQLIPMRGGKRMTIGLDIVLVLGQLPEERVEGAPRPTQEEFDLFMAAIAEMEPAIRSRINILLQQIPPEEYGTVDALEKIKKSVALYVNDTLERLNFGKGLRPELGRRRVTDVFLPMFVRQYM